MNQTGKIQKCFSELKQEVELKHIFNTASHTYKIKIVERDSYWNFTGKHYRWATINNYTWDYPGGDIRYSAYDNFLQEVGRKGRLSILDLRNGL